MKRAGVVVFLVLVATAAWGLLAQRRKIAALEHADGKAPSAFAASEASSHESTPPMAPSPAPTKIVPRFGPGHLPTAEDREVLAFQRSAERLFGGVVDGLAIAQSAKLKLKQLLAERFEAAAEAKRLMSQQHKREDASQVVIAATAQVDREITALVGEDLGRDMTYMASSLTFGSLQATFVLDTQFAGVPLSGQQLLLLSRTFDQDSPTTGTAAPVNSSDGLAVSDHKVYEHAMNFLSPNQLVLLHDYLVVRHK